MDGYIDKLTNGELKKHTKTAAWKNILEKAKNLNANKQRAEPESEEEEPWEQKLTAQVRARVIEFLVKNKVSEREKEILKDVADNYLNTLRDGGYAKHNLAKAWKSIKNSAIRIMEEEAEEGGEQEEERDEEPRPRTKKRRSNTPRDRTIRIVSSWVKRMGIKPKSRYTLKMDTLLEDNLVDDWENTNSKQLAHDIIQQFKDRYPEYIRTLNRRNKIKNPRKPPQWSKATLQKRKEQRDANKHKIEERAKRKDLHKRYICLLYTSDAADE